MTIIEGVAAGAVLLVMTVPLVDLVSTNTAQSLDANRRVVLELRARRHQAEVAATTYDAAVGAGERFPVVLAEPSEAEGYAEYTKSLTEKTTLGEIKPGLAEVRTRMVWKVGRGDWERKLEVRRLVADPTHALRLAAPLSVVPR